MTTAVNDLVARASALLKDTNNTFWSTATLVTFLNEAQLEVVTALPDRHGTRATVADAITSALQSLPADAIVLQRVVENTTSKSQIYEVDQKVMNSELPAWKSTTGADDARQWMREPHDPKKFLVYPPSTASSSYEIDYVAKPAAATAGNNITIDDEYGDALVDYTVARALSIDSDHADPGRAAAYMASFNERIGKG